MAEPRFTVIAARTDSTYRSVTGENLTEEMAIALMACSKRAHANHLLWDADGDAIPYLSVMRWFMLPQQTAAAPNGA